MTSPLTVGERIILHLARYSKYQEDYDVPLDVSQDGIASALRISRAHAAIELKKLKETNDVSERLAHIRKGKNRRKVYFLTMRGKEKAEQIQEYAEKEGIDVEPLLDLRRCSGKDLLDTLDPESRGALAKACTFRRPFRREGLPETNASILQRGENGLVEMPSDLRREVLELLDEFETKRSHSFAADYWLREGDYRERLYHLLASGREQEAHMLISSRGNELLNQADEDLFTICQDLTEPCDRYRSAVYRFLVELCLITEHQSECLEMISSLRESEGPADQEFASVAEGRLLLQQNEAEAALDILEKVKEHLNNDDIRLECEISRALMACSRYGEAKTLLEELLPETSRNGDGGGIVEIQYLLGKAHLRLGEPADAIRYLSKGMGASREKDLSRWYSKMAEAYLALGMREKAEEFHSMTLGTIKRSSP